MSNNSDLERESNRSFLEEVFDSEAEKGAFDVGFEKVIVKKNFNGEEIDVTMRKQPLSAGFRTLYYAPQEPGTYIVNNLIYERDIPVKLRDGRTIYADIYRPQGQTNIPVILAWTPYGKRHWYAENTPGLYQAIGVPKGTISKLPPFEAPDPMFWCAQGYAIANVDAPGTGYSEGDNTIWTEQGGKDGYDFIEWVATQKWCNGKVGMIGNSGLAMSQWYIAAECPPHLAAIAPWEGTSDLYREWAAPGGVTHTDFTTLIFGDYRGPGLTEDLTDMIRKYPMMNGYWEDKIAKVEKIKIPTYITAGYCHAYHLRASVGNFNKIKSKKKWIRMHRNFEWADFNNPQNIDDAKRFFDRYLKDVHNGWEMTPKVRVEVTDAYEYDYVTNRPEEDWPIPRTEYTKFYLNASDNSLTKEPVTEKSSLTYDSAKDEALFEFTFDEETEITGHSKLRLWLAAETAEEADVFVEIRKLDCNGKHIPTHVHGEEDPGFLGKLRASHRELDQQKSTEYLPVHTHKNKQPLVPGEPVALDIEIWPNSKIWHKGEKLQVCVSGKLVRSKTWFMPTNFEKENDGNHVIYTGGEYESYFLAPVVPPKYTCGEYVYRG